MGRLLGRRGEPRGLSPVRGSIQVLVDEVASMPDAALGFAREVSKVWTPEHLVDAREQFLSTHQGELAVLMAALRRRFPDAGETINCFYAAVDAALMAHLEPKLSATDRRLLRQLWDALLHAR